MKYVFNQKNKLYGTKVVIFDVDGTLYNQKLMRLFMFIEILISLLINPKLINEIKTIKEFSERENKRTLEVKKDQCLEELQYENIISNKKNGEIKKIVKKWIQKTIKISKIL